MRKIKYGIIGAGGMGQGHMECIKHIDAIEVVAAADPYQPSLDDFAQRNPNKDARYFTNYKELLQIEEIDAVVIATPDNTHVDIIEDCVAAEKHILSEKPAATTLQDLNRLEKLVKRHKKIYQLGLELRYHPVFQRMDKLITDRIIETPRMIWCKEFRNPFLKKVDNWIMSQEKTGGVFVEKTCHYFDLMNWFSQSTPKKVIAMAGQEVVKDIYGIKPDIFDHGWVMIEYANNVRAMLGLCMFCNCMYDVEIGVIGENAVMEGFLNQSKIKIIEYKTNTTNNIEVGIDKEIRKLSHNGSVYLQHQAFIKNIRENTPPVTGFELAKWSTLVGLAAEESARNGNKPVTF